MNETRYRYFALDSDHNISAGTLEVSVDRVTWVAATYVPSPPATAAAEPAPTAGRTRYWWRHLFTFDITSNPFVYGRFTDSPGPEVTAHRWRIYR